MLGFKETWKQSSKEGHLGAGGKNPHVLAKIKVEKDGYPLPAQ